MTAATPGPSGPNIFSMFSSESGLYRAKREAFVFSLAGQAAILGLLIYFATSGVGTPITISDFRIIKELPLIYSGHNGGGGGNRDPLPASAGNLPMPSLQQFAPPTVMHPTAMPKLPMPQSVEVAPELNLAQGGQIGDPLSKFKALSDGSGGPTGIGPGCCGGVGPSTGPFAGDGPPGIYPAGRGATVPEVIYNPEPSFSDEARKAKQQGIVGLMLVVGKDGHTYDIRVRQSLGMGLDEKAIEAVSRWRFRPGMRQGLPVATQIAVEVNFRLY